MFLCELVVYTDEHQTYSSQHSIRQKSKSGDRNKSTWFRLHTQRYDIIIILTCIWTVLQQFSCGMMAAVVILMMRCTNQSLIQDRGQIGAEAEMPSGLRVFILLLCRDCVSWLLQRDPSSHIGLRKEPDMRRSSLPFKIKYKVMYRFSNEACGCGSSPAGQ